MHLSMTDNPTIEFNKEVRKDLLQAVYILIPKGWNIAILLWVEPLKPGFPGVHTESLTPS